jgi:antitoxin (DNA-binding transcriptional repressor) of toxin-antitoxin stability system
MIESLDQLGQTLYATSMKKVNLYQAKTDLSALVEQAAAGEEIIIAKNGKARAKLVAVSANDDRPPPRFGFWNHYGWKLPEGFDDPDPEIEAMFYGDDEPEAPA